MDVASPRVQGEVSVGIQRGLTDGTEMKISGSARQLHNKQQQLARQAVQQREAEEAGKGETERDERKDE